VRNSTTVSCQLSVVLNASPCCHIEVSHVTFR